MENKESGIDVNLQTLSHSHMPASALRVTNAEYTARHVCDILEAYFIRHGRENCPPSWINYYKKHCM